MLSQGTGRDAGADRVDRDAVDLGAVDSAVAELDADHREPL